MTGENYIIIQIAIYGVLGFVIGYGCKAFVCHDNNDDQLEALENEFDRMEAQNNEEIERRSQQIIDRIDNCQQVVAYPVTPSAPGIAYDDSVYDN